MSIEEMHKIKEEIERHEDWAKHYHGIVDSHKEKANKLRDQLKAAKEAEDGRALKWTGFSPGMNVTVSHGNVIYFDINKESVGVGNPNNQDALADFILKSRGFKKFQHNLPEFLSIEMVNKDGKKVYNKDGHRVYMEIHPGATLYVKNEEA